jgi:hypothetical protein
MQLLTFMEAACQIAQADVGIGRHTLVEFAAVIPHLTRWIGNVAFFGASNSGDSILIHSSGRSADIDLNA